MSEKTTNICSSTPRGFTDLEAEDIRCLEKMTGKIAQTLELWGFDPVQQPLIDYSSSLGKFLPDHERPNEGVFSFQDDDKQWLSLRYDLTAPLVRFVAENFERLPKPYRSYRSGWVFRNEKPGPGRFRQFMQFDADTTGSTDVAADAEMLALMGCVLEKLGFSPETYVLRMNHRKLLDGLLESIGIPETPETSACRLAVLRSIDKLDKLGIEGVISLLGKGRLDRTGENKGDFTQGAGLTSSQIDKVLAHISYKKTLPEFLSSCKKEIPGCPKSSEGLADLEKIATILLESGTSCRQVVVDTSLVRGMEYYTGPVYEAGLLFDIPNNQGLMVRCGAVSGGGRYDDLLTRFGKKPTPSTGFSIGVSRLMAALKNTGKTGFPCITAPVLVLMMNRDTPSIARQQKMVSILHEAGIRAELYLGEGGMKAQMKYADRRQSPCVVIQGDDEFQQGVIQVKDLVQGMQLSREILENRQWRESRPAQVSVPESALVKTVTAILEKQHEAQKNGSSS